MKSYSKDAGVISERNSTPDRGKEFSKHQKLTIEVRFINPHTLSNEEQTRT